LFAFAGKTKQQKTYRWIESFILSMSPILPFKKKIPDHCFRAALYLFSPKHAHPKSLTVARVRKECTHAKAGGKRPHAAHIRHPGHHTCLATFHCFLPTERVMSTTDLSIPWRYTATSAALKTQGMLKFNVFLINRNKTTEAI